MFKMNFLTCIILYFVALSYVNCGRISFDNKRSKQNALNFLDADSGEITKEILTPPKKGMLVGAPRKIDSKDSYANKLLTEHLKRLVTGDSKEILVNEINEITQQLVAGYLFKIKGKFNVESVEKVCTISILNQPWNTSEEEVIISAKCEDGSCYVTKTYTCSPDSLYSLHPLRSHRLMLFS